MSLLSTYAINNSVLLHKNKMKFLYYMQLYTNHWYFNFNLTLILETFMY